MRTWQAHTGGIAALAFSPDGRVLVSAGYLSPALAVWDALGGGHLASVPPPVPRLGGSEPYPAQVTFGADSRFVAAVYRAHGQRVVVGVLDRWADPPAWVFADTFDGHSATAAFAGPDLWLGLRDELRVVRGWRTPAPVQIAATSEGGHPAPRARLAAPPDGAWVGAHLGRWAGVWDAGGELRHRSAPLAGNANYARLVFSADSATLALILGHRLTLWDFVGGTTAKLSGHKGVIWGVGFSPDGSQVHTLSSDGRRRTFDAATGRQLRALDLGIGGLYAAAFSPDGRMGAAGGEDGGAVVFDLGE